MEKLLSDFQEFAGMTYLGPLVKAGDILEWLQDGLISEQEAMYRLWDHHDQSRGV